MEFISDKSAWGFVNEKPIDKDAKVKYEWEIFNAASIDPGICPHTMSVIDVRNRHSCTFYEKDYNMPQNIFFINVSDDVVIFGRKILSQLYRTGQLTALNCSRLTAEMIYGVLCSYHSVDRTIVINYYPLLPHEKKYIFNQIKNNPMTEIRFPFRRCVYETGAEVIAPEKAWHYYENLDIYLARGEEHIRNFTINYLKSKQFSMPFTAYDPACSTGDFLASIKKNFPHAHTIGGDISEEMVAVAQGKVDQLFCEDAKASSIPDGSVDILFLRFLNYYVMDSKEAHAIYEIMKRKVKVNGTIIAFGHTPVLVDSQVFSDHQFKLVNSSGYDMESDSIFQFYVITRLDSANDQVFPLEERV